MESATGKKVLVSGASIAGLATAYWLHKLGYHVTVVELAAEPRRGGAAVDVRGTALASARQMGILAQLKAHRVQMERLEFKNAEDVTEGALQLQREETPVADEDLESLEIEREQLVDILLAALPHEVDFLFNDRITALRETAEAMHVTFGQGAARAFDLVVGCDGLHSGVRQLWFGPEADYSHFLGHYFWLTIVPQALVAPNTGQLYNTPGKGVMLSTYHGRTDIKFWFFSEQELSYDYRNTAQQRALLAEQFADQGWRTAELLAAVGQAPVAYFDKFAQIKMPAWTKGRVALVGDAGYCASPAAGIGASLALGGAAALAEALATHNGTLDAAFPAYHDAFRPFVEAVQASALGRLDTFIVPKTAAAIQARNTQGAPA
ncbi:MAG: FAD-dependent monooxygenase [Janthinobacterium lividum]